MVRFLLCTLSVMVCVSSMAVERSDSEMQHIAQTLLLGSLAKGSNMPKVQKIKSTDLFNIYGIKGVGFVVVSRDDAYGEVLGYSSTTFNETTMPGGLKWWLMATEKTMLAQKSKGITPFRATYAPVEQMVHTTWGQDTPYNDKCPKLDGKLTLTGCVATAMSQIMNYFKYPEKGTGRG